MRVLLLIISSGIFPTVVFADIIYRSHLFSCSYSEFKSHENELSAQLTLNCYDELYGNYDVTAIRYPRVEHWWAFCKEQYTENDNDRLKCFVVNNFWELTFGSLAIR